MKIAVITDIHSNHTALEACLDRAKTLGAEMLVFLGDYITDCPYPKKTVELLYRAKDEFPCRFIRGNREDYILSHRRDPNDGWHYCSQSGSLLYTYEELSEADLDFFEAMPVSEVISIEGCPPFSACHGSMTDNRRLFDPKQGGIDDIIKEQRTELTVCGHSHEPYFYSAQGKRIINPGTLLAPTANMLILTSDGGPWQAEHIEVLYDTEKVIAEFTDSGLIGKANVWARGIITVLRKGIGFDLEVIGRVHKWSKERILPIDTEELWQEAAREIGI